MGKPNYKQKKVQLTQPLRLFQLSLTLYFLHNIIYVGDCICK